jgi:uncharacterized protein YecT (DUF1311 family)
MRLAAIAVVITLMSSSAGMAADVDCAKATTQRDMNDCAHREFMRVDSALNGAYRLLLQHTDRKEQDALRAAQRAWLVYRDKECTFESASSSGGSIHGMEYDACLTTMTTARTTELGRLASDRN